MAFCQKTQSLLRHVNRRESSSLDLPPLPSETWALKGVLVIICLVFLVLSSWGLFLLWPKFIWKRNCCLHFFQHIQAYHVSCRRANYRRLPRRGPIKWEPAGRGCPDWIPCYDQSSSWRRRKGERTCEKPPPAKSSSSPILADQLMSMPACISWSASTHLQVDIKLCCSSCKLLCNLSPPQLLLT